MDDDEIVIIDDDGGGGDRWSPSQRLAIAALTAGGSYADAAAAASVSSRTVARWMAGAEFRGEVEAGKSARVARVTALLLDSADEAVAVLRSECRDAQRSADRVRAAGLLLAHGLRYRSQTEVEDRIRDIERRLGLVIEDGDAE